MLKAAIKTQLKSDTTTKSEIYQVRQKTNTVSYYQNPN